MRIDKLELEVAKWGEHQGQLRGRVRFIDKSENTIELNLTEALSERFLAVVGDAINDAARDLQARLVANLGMLTATATRLPAPGDD